MLDRLRPPLPANRRERQVSGFLVTFTELVMVAGTVAAAYEPDPVLSGITGALVLALAVVRCAFLISCYLQKKGLDPVQPLQDGLVVGSFSTRPMAYGVGVYGGEPDKRDGFLPALPNRDAPKDQPRHAGGYVKPFPPLHEVSPSKAALCQCLACSQAPQTPRWLPRQQWRRW